MAVAALAAALAALLMLTGCSDDDGSAARAVNTPTTAEVAGSSAPDSSTADPAAPDSSQTATSPAGGAGSEDDEGTSSGGGTTASTEASGGDGGEAPGTETSDRTSAGGGTTAGAALTYSNAEYGIEFAYPAEWRLTEDISAEGTAGSSAVGSIGAFDPRGTQKNGVLLDGVVVSVYQLAATVDESLMPVFEEEVASILPQLEEQLNDFLVVEPLHPAKVNGLDGFETTYTFTQDGQELRNRLLFLVSGDTEYQLTIQGAASTWDKLQPAFDVILSTLRSTG